jgi:flavin-dependent dehydrogenase
MKGYDVVIIGGGPAGSTIGCLVKKYMPHLSVLILEKARFPRHHIGESLLAGATRHPYSQ